MQSMAVDHRGRICRAGPGNLTPGLSKVRADLGYVAYWIRGFLPKAVAFGQHRPNVRRNELVNFSKLGEQFFNEIEECALISQRALTDVGGG
jgi:hypothetical protein